MKKEYIGAVKWFSEKRKYGFIYLPDLDKDAFIHLSVVRACGLSCLQSNDCVEASVDCGSGSNSEKLEVKRIKLITLPRRDRQITSQAKHHDATKSTSSHPVMRAEVEHNNRNGTLIFDGRIVKFRGGILGNYTTQRDIRSIKEVQVNDGFFSTVVMLKGPGGTFYMEYMKPWFGKNKFNRIISAIKIAIRR